MLEKYREIQANFYNFINLSFSNNKISHAYLIETNGVSYAEDLVIDLVKFFLCDGVYDEKICNLIDKGNYPNFVSLDFSDGIKKEEIINLKRKFSLKSVDNKKMIYLIKDASLLNKSSANSLLKFLEEPEDGIIAVLMVDNVNKVIETISSRSQIISLVNNERFDYKTIFNYYDENDDDFDTFVNEQNDIFASFYDDLEEKKTDLLLKKDIYDLNDRMKYLLKYGLFLYFDVLNIKLNRNVDKFLPNVSFISKIIDNNSFDDIIYKIDVINKFISDSFYNVNQNLFMDNFIISMRGR